MNWKDISNYSQRDIERNPKTWELRLARLKIIVTRHIHHAPDAWVLTCEPFCNGLDISNGTADEAKVLAIEYVRKNLERCISELPHNAQGNLPAD